MAFDFVRQISSPFTTRLALVFASWADENIIRIETVQDAFVASSQESFFFLTSNKLLNNCLKCLKRLERLEVLVFHVTTEQGFHGIQESGAVTANTAGLLPFTFSQSAVSYFRKNGCVSLIDLRDISDENLHDGIRKYYFFQPFRSSRIVFLILKSTGYPAVISWEVSRSEGVGAMIVPYLEAGYQDEIPLDHIELALIVDVASNQANALSLP